MILDQIQFNRLLTDLLAYYGKPINETVQAAWFVACSEDLDDDRFSAAVVACFRECRFMPTINEFIALVKGDNEALETEGNIKAWEAIMEGAKIAGSLREDHIEQRSQITQSLNPAQRRALYLVGGFTKIGELPQNDLHWRRKEFLETVKNIGAGVEALDRKLEGSLSPIAGTAATALEYIQGRLGQHPDPN